MLINKSFAARITVLHEKVQEQAEDRECSHGKIHYQVSCHHSSKLHRIQAGTVTFKT